MKMIGRLGKSYGLKGFVKIYSESGENEHFLSLSFVFVGSSQENSRKLIIEDSLIKSENVLLKFQGFDSPESLKVLSGSLLWVPKSMAAPLRGGEFYVSDFLGCLVKGERGSVLGKVDNILYGARYPLLQVLGKNISDFIIPLDSHFITEFSQKEGFIIVKESSLIV